MIFRRAIGSLLATAGVLVSMGCSNGGHEMSHDALDLSMEPIQVELDWSPQQVSINEKIVLEASVTQGGEPVNDAKEVVFEIVGSTDKEQKLEWKGEQSGEGVYTAEGILEQEGTYTVTSHVSARTQHSMPSKPLTVLP
ncbi:FixH family protein [Paenibacillus donghaensis]|nr:FixH family protein [Paenibacillus donghaensis]